MLLGKTRRLVVAALMAAFAVILVYVAVLIPTNRLFFLGGSTLALLVATVEGGLALGATAAVAAGLLVFFLLPVGPWTLAFWLFFAPYAVVRQLALRVLALGPAGWVMSWLIKLAHFNSTAYLLLVLSGGRPLLSGQWLPAWALVVGGEITFLVYDWALGYFLSYYRRRIR